MYCSKNKRDKILRKKEEHHLHGFTGQQWWWLAAEWARREEKAPQDWEYRVGVKRRKDQRLERKEQSFNEDLRGREIDGREMETWRAVCSREGESENRDGKRSHLGFHRGLSYDGGQGRLLKRVGDPSSLGHTSTIQNHRSHRAHNFAQWSHDKSTGVTRPVESRSFKGSKHVKSCDFTN